MIDAIPERAGRWKTRNLHFPDNPSDKFCLRYRNVLEAIRGLIGDPTHAQDIVYAPKKIFTNRRKSTRVYSEMWTGQWWNAVQVSQPFTICSESFLTNATQRILPKGATVAPIIIATDKTQLTNFTGGKKAYPVYITLGNLPRSIRQKPTKHACVLLGYLPVDKVDETHISETEARSRRHYIFHRAMREILDPLRKAGKQGVEMVCGDGWVRRIHPILACYVADYPEQCLVTCSKGNSCPKCYCSKTQFGEPNLADLRTQESTLQVISQAAEETINKSDSVFRKACQDRLVSGYVTQPFWEGFPYANIHVSITPDVLHQLYQGVVKHLVEWVQSIMSEKELDARIRALPPAFGVRQFTKGISHLEQVTGPERKAIAKILLGCLIGKMPTKGLAACRALLDFVYMAQNSSQDDVTLDYMRTALKEWFKNRSYFTDVGVRMDFDIPKFHSLLHYIESIELFGTTDNYNTETFERLHIDFAKKGWRASNHKDEFPQMIQWLTRQEKIVLFEKHLQWRQEQHPQQDHSSGTQTKRKRPPEVPMDIGLRRKISPSGEFVRTPVMSSKDMVSNKTGISDNKSNYHSNNVASSPSTTPVFSLAKHAPLPNRPLSVIENGHSSPSFSADLKQFLNRLSPNPLHKSSAAAQTLPFQKLDIWTQFKFHPAGLHDDDEEDDIVKALPKTKDNNFSRFDTVIALNTDEGESTGLKGMYRFCAGLHILRYSQSYRLCHWSRAYHIQTTKPLQNIVRDLQRSELLSGTTLGICRVV